MIAELAGKEESIFFTDPWIFCQDIRNHPILIMLVDSTDDCKIPQKLVETAEEHDKSRFADIMQLIKEKDFGNPGIFIIFRF